VSSPFHWGFLVFAFLATLGSIVVRTNLSEAVGLAAIAVIAAGLALWDGVRQAPRATFTGPSSFEEPVGAVRVLLGEGRHGREGIIVRLDALERRSLNPNLPVRSPAEIRRLTSLSQEEFRRRVAARLDELEKAP
jgi:hypothetical protein